jgi:hypothetical protein
MLRGMTQRAIRISSTHQPCFKGLSASGSARIAAR